MRKEKEHILTQTRDIFISHASGDHVFAYQLALSLARHGFTVWFDVFDIRPGQHFQREYTQAIHASSVVLVVLSPRSSKSAWVNDEISKSLAVEHSSGVEVLIPVLIEDCKTPETIGQRAYVDFRHSHTRGMSVLINELRTRGLPPRSIDLPRAESMIVPIELRDEVSLNDSHFHQFAQTVLYALPSDYKVRREQIRVSLSENELILRTQILRNADFSDMAADFSRIVEEQDLYIQEGVALLLNQTFRGKGWEDIPRIPLLASFLKCERTLCLRHLLGGQRTVDVPVGTKNDYQSYLDVDSGFWGSDGVLEVRAWLDTDDGRAHAPYRAVFPEEQLSRDFCEMSRSAFATYIAPFVLRDFLKYGRPIQWTMKSFRVYKDQ